MPLSVGDAVLTFLGDTTELDQAFARIPEQADASMSAAAEHVGKLNFELDATASNAAYAGGEIKEAMDKTTGAMAVGQNGAVRLGEVMNLAGEKTRESMYQARGETQLLGEMFGVHLPRHIRSFIAELPGLGTALSAAFTATAVIFLVDMIAKAIDKHEQLAKAAEKAALATENLAIKERDHTASLELTNLKLDDQIAKLEHRPERNKLEEALLEAGIAADQLAEKFAKDFEQMDEEIIKTTSFFGRLTQDMNSWKDLILATPETFAGAWHKVVNGTKDVEAALAGVRAQTLAINKLRAEPIAKTEEEAVKQQNALAAAYELMGQKAKAAMEIVQKQAPENIAAIEKLSGLIVSSTAAQVDAGKTIENVHKHVRETALETQDAIAKAAEKAFRESSREMHEAMRLMKEDAIAAAKETASKLEESEKLKIAATRQGSQARLDAIDAAIKEEESKQLQDTAFYKSLQIQRVQAVEAALAAEQKAENQAAADKLKLAETSAKVQIAAITEAYSQQEKAVEQLANFHLMSEARKARTLELLYQQEKDALLKTLTDTLKEEQDAIAASQAKLTTAKSNPFISPQQISELERLLHEAEKLEADTQVKISNTTKQFNDRELAAAKGHYGQALALATAYGKAILAEQLMQTHAELLAAQQELALAKARGQDTTAIQLKIVALKQHEQQLEKEANGNKQLIAQQLQLTNAQLLGAQAVLTDAKARGLDTTAIEKEIARLKQLQIELQKTTQDTHSLAQAEDNLKNESNQLAQSLGNAFANAMEQIMTGQKTVGQAAKEMIATMAEQWGKFYIAKGIADMFTNPAAGAIELAEGTALLALGVALGAGGGFGGSSNGGNPNQSSGLIAGQTSSSGGGSHQTVSVTHLAEGGLVTGPTRALIGERGDEAVIPLTDPDAMSRLANALLSPRTLRLASSDPAAIAAHSNKSQGGLDDAAMAKLGDIIGAHLDQSGGAAGDTHIHAHIEGLISPDNLHKVMKQMSNRVLKNQSNLHSSNSLRITRRSQ